MRKIYEVLRLSVADGRSHREIARAIVASPTTVGEILRRAKLHRLVLPVTVEPKTKTLNVLKGHTRVRQVQRYGQTIGTAVTAHTCAFRSFHDTCGMAGGLPAALAAAR